MSQKNLLEIVPDQLFQTHFINDIDNVQKELQYEIERKREVLRTVVGENYRDLIHAADTIEEMKDTTNSTLNHIKEMISACKNLHDTHLVGFKINEKPIQQPSYQSSNSVQAISVQVKLLMEIPERIWICIETENFEEATQLFVLARHINTGLQLHIGGKNVKGNMLSLQKLVQQHWHSISNFNQTIIDVCQEKLQDVNISTQVACSCLVSLYVLDSKSMVELLNTLIGLHSNSSLKNTLQFQLSHLIEGDVKAQIKEKIVNSVKVVLRTVELVYDCFVEENGGAVLAKLKDLFRKDSQPLVELVHFSDHNAVKLLPPVIANYRLTSNKDVQELIKKDITDCVQTWSVWVKSFIDQNVKTLLDNITKIKVLHEIREEAFKIETPNNWNTICKSLDIPELHVWCHYFQPLLTSRVKTIIDDRWRNVLEAFKSQMLTDITRVSSQDATEKEADINWFVWRDLIGDTVIETRNDVISVMNSLMKGMWLQDRGFTPNLEKLCRSLDDELQRLLEDLSVYLSGDNPTPRTKESLLYTLEEDDGTKQMFIDKVEVQMYLRDVAEVNIHNILQHIKEHLQDSTLNQSELQKKSKSIYMARFTQAVTHLVPSLRRCFIYEDRSEFDYADIDVDSNKRWDRLCELLKTNCVECWTQWVDIVMKQVVILINAGLPQEFTMEANIDYLLVQWDLIKIEEKDDEGNAVESTIKVPSGPSLKLQEFLYSVSRLLDEVVPHTLPVDVHTAFVERVSNITFVHYNRVIRENEADINQRCALQLLMDVRHLTLLFVPREKKKAIDFSQELCEFLRQKIDPFDYDVFYPYIQTNLKRSLQRVQTLLGSLVLHHGQVSGVVGARPVTSGGTADQAPGALSVPLADGAWYSLLPVAAPQTQARHKADRVKKKAPTASPSRSARSEISELMTSSLPINLASARSNAASFFNSMTSEWFSGS